MNFVELPDGRIHLAQPHRIDQITKETGITPRMVGKSTPAASTKILNRSEGDKKNEIIPFITKGLLEN